MILIGQFDSPFVRRVAIAMKIYDLPFEHRPWSVWGDSDRLAQYNPLRRVPTLVMDDGECLIESSAIIDMLDEVVGPQRAMLPGRGAARRTALRIIALSTGLADKAVSLFYEPLLRTEPSEKWMARCRQQMTETLAALESARALGHGAYWHGETIGHADIAMACSLRFTNEAHPGLIDTRTVPRLLELATRCEEMPAFREISQPLIVKTNG